MTADDQRRSPTQLTDDQRLDWLRLIRSDRIGPATFSALLGHFGSAAAAIEAAPELAKRGGRAIRICPVDAAQREMDELDRLGARLIAISENDYPPLLVHIDGPPPLIAVRGNAAIFSRPTIAIVGSRNASITGVKIAKSLARDLGGQGYAIASGLARGIDAAAHEASLEGGTIAVLAGGLNRIYPPGNVRLAQAIVDNGGAHLSEMPIGWEPRARDFPRRNRLVSGLSLAAVIVEAAARSGSLITARLAGEQGRLVFAVPGSPLDPRSVGANRLIRDGAYIVTDVNDIITEIAPMLGQPAVQISPIEETPSAKGPSAPEPADSDRERVVAALGPTPVDLDDIVRFTELPPATIHYLLLELDLAGRIAHHAGGRVSLVMHQSR
jgi:DNA processing protein